MKTLGIWLIVVFVFVGGYFFIHKAQGENTPAKEEPSVQQVSSKKTEKPAQTDLKSNIQSLAISDINEQQKGRQVSVSGYITKYSDGKENVFFTIKDPNKGTTIKCVLFASDNNELAGRREIIVNALSKNKLVFVDGEVDIYKGELEIKAKKVYIP